MVSPRLPSSKVARDLLECELLGIPTPLELFVRNRSARSTSKLVVNRLCSTDLPTGSFVKVSERVYVSSPEFCFLQMARHLSHGMLVNLGLEICGAYVLAPESSEGFLPSEPIATPTTLREYLERAGGVHGVKSARRAVGCVLSGSASPMESALVELLCLPGSFGGYDLPWPEMNPRVSVWVGEGLRRRQHTYRCDLYWARRRVAVEYDSDLAHTGPERIARDARRRNNLASSGVSVVTVSRQQAYSMEAFDEVAHQIARHLGARPRGERARGNLWERRRRLREELLAPSAADR